MDILFVFLLFIKGMFIILFLIIYRFKSFFYFIKILVIYSKNYTTRIIGGQETTIEKFPYQVMVLCAEDFTVSLCGGALINKKTILTAAHCAYGCSQDNLIVIAGKSFMLNIKIC